MFPETYHAPAGGLQCCIRCLVPFNVPAELWRPIPFVTGRLPSVLRTDMPEAPINEDRDPTRSEDDVRSNTDAAREVEAEILPVPVASSVQRTTERNLRLGVRTAVRLHVPGASLGSWLRVGPRSPRLRSPIAAVFTGHAAATTRSVRPQCVSWAKIVPMTPPPLDAQTPPGGRCGGS